MVNRRSSLCFMSFMILATSALSLAACGSSEEKIFVAQEFDTSAAQKFRETGPNTIKGQAILRTSGGEVRTCAGMETFLLVSQPYSLEFFSKLAPNGFRDTKQSYEASDVQKELFTNARQTTCNAQGTFTFANVPDGSWFVVTEVTWKVPSVYGAYILDNREGGLLARQVSVEGGQVAEIYLTP